METKVSVYLADMLELDGLIANYQRLLIDTPCKDSDNDARLIEIGRCECILSRLEREYLND